MKKNVGKAVFITSCAIVVMFSICFFVVGVCQPGFFLSVGSFFGNLFHKSYNDDLPFAQKGLFIYENEHDEDISIQKIAFYFNEYQSDDEYDVVFTNSLKQKYGLNLLITSNGNTVSDYSVNFLKKEKTLRGPYHYTYMYFFNSKVLNDDYIFSLESQGEKYISFSFSEPCHTYATLFNQLGE